MISDLLKTTTNDPSINHAMALGVAQEFERMGLRYHSEQKDMIGAYISYDICFKMVKSGHLIEFLIVKPVPSVAIQRSFRNVDQTIFQVRLNEEEATAKVMNITNEKDSFNTSVKVLAEYDYADPKIFEKIAAKTAELL